METEVIRGTIRQKDDLGQNPDDAILRFNLATECWIAIREKGLDSESATNEIERLMHEFWKKAEPRSIPKKKTTGRRHLLGDPLQRPKAVSQNEIPVATKPISQESISS